MPLPHPPMRRASSLDGLHSYGPGFGREGSLAAQFRLGRRPPPRRGAHARIESEIMPRRRSTIGIAGDFALILLAALVGGVVARALRLPLALGYILAGIAVGPYTIGPVVSEIADIELLADVGVALLLFSLGLDFPLARLKPIRRVALIGTPLQLAATITVGYALARVVLGAGRIEAVWFGALLSFSSTAVVLKTLMERDVLGTLASRVMMGMLIVQDLALVPALTILPALGSSPAGLGPLAWSAGRATLLIAAIVLFGTRVLPRLMERVVAWRSRELFLVCVLAIGLGVGYGTYLLGLSLAIGAFLAGMVLSESAYSHQALADITPLRDIFAMLFFVTVGMLVDPAFLWARAPTISVVVAVLLVAKGLVFAGVTRLFGYRRIVPLVAGLGLFQIGEFSFVLARLGLGAGRLGQDLYSIFLGSAVASMALTPFTLRAAGSIYAWWRRNHPLPVPEVRESGSGDVATVETDHVVLAGYGRVGAFVARLLKGVNRAPVVIELDPYRVAAAEAEGLRVVYGDATAVPVLQAAGVARARLVLLAIPDAISTALAAERVRETGPSVHVVARAPNEEVLAELGRLGVYRAVQPELEAGLELCRQALAHLGGDPLEAQAAIDLMRRDSYAPLVKEVGLERWLPSVRRLFGTAGVAWAIVSEGSPLAGLSIGEADVRRRTGAVIVAIDRGGQVRPTPGPKEVLSPGDAVAILGTASQREAFALLVGRSGPEG